MNKGELIAALAAKTEKTKKESEAALNGILDVIAESMAKGEKVQLIGFGTFEAKERPARLQGPRFQGRQGSEGRCEQEEKVIFRFAMKAVRFISRLFLCMTGMSRGLGGSPKGRSCRRTR